METFSPLLALWEGYAPVTFGFLKKGSISRIFDGFFDISLNMVDIVKEEV